MMSDLAPSPGKKRNYVHILSLLERDPNARLNLTSVIDGRAYLTHAIGEMACRISKDGVSVSSRSKWILRVAGDCEIRMIQEIERFGA